MIVAEVLTVREVSDKTGLSRQTISRMFESEPGVIVLSRPEDVNKRKQRYRSIRIPRAVYERVIGRITNR